MTRTSPVLHEFDPQGFEIGVIAEMRIARRARHPRRGAAYLADLSAIGKRLVVGKTAPAWLAALGVQAPRGLLECRTVADDAMVVRLHRDQYLLVDGVDSPVFEPVFALGPGRHDEVLVLEYESAEFALGGPSAPAVIAELAPLNVAGAPDDIWLATRMAHCEVALRTMISPALHFRVGCSPADARFLFGILRDCVVECGGCVLGFDDYANDIKKGDPQ